MNAIHRRDFLRLLGLLPLLSLPVEHAAPARQSTSDRPNILILLFDSFAAPHASFYGYPRQTTPNLARLAERAVVFHRHYANGNFTNPGTASLLTGTLPWTHRSFQPLSPIISTVEQHSLFHALAQTDYYSFGYTHNLLVRTLLHQFRESIDQIKPTRDLCVLDFHLADRLFPNDYAMAIWRERTLRAGEKPPTYPSSLIYYSLNRQLWLRRKEQWETAYREHFPRGLPNQHERIYLLEHAMDWFRDTVADFPRPYLAYFHFMPPHDPYCTRREFYGKFDDGWQPVQKPEHHFSEQYSQAELNRLRMEYDEFIAYVDAEFGRLYDHLERSGQLDNTYLIVTSDHGEAFERGIWMHVTPVLYEPLIHIPLLIQRPGQTQREDVYTPTSAIDIVPTLLHLAGEPIPAWCEGDILPALGGAPSTDRPVFVLDSKPSFKRGPLNAGTLAMLRGRYKLIYYFGYADFDAVYELYDLEADPEELDNLYTRQPTLAAEMREILLAALHEADRRNTP